MANTDKSRHAFGNSQNLQNALNQGSIDAYDILFLDGDTNPNIGWVDKNGVIRKVVDKAQIVRVDELPTSEGDENVVYVYQNAGYVWDTTTSQCVPLAKSEDLTVLENQVTNLTTQMTTKVDATTVQNMIDEASANEVVTF